MVLGYHWPPLSCQPWTILGIPSSKSIPGYAITSIYSISGIVAVVKFCSLRHQVTNKLNSFVLDHVLS